MELATVSASKNAKEYSAALVAGDINLQTWRAICRRGGWFKSSKGSKEAAYNWNTDFSEFYLYPLAGSWKPLLVDMLVAQEQVYLNVLCGKLAEFSTLAKSSVETLCGQYYPPALEFLLKRVPHMQNRVREHIKKAFETLQRRVQDINLEIKALIVDGLKVVYKKCLTGEKRKCH